MPPCIDIRKAKLLSNTTTVRLNYENFSGLYDPDLLLKLFAVVQQGLEVRKAEGSVEAVPIWPCLTNV